MQTKSLLALSATVAIIAATMMSIGVTMKAYGQNATAPPQQEAANTTQIKNYLTQAIQALDSGNNTKAFQQLELAEDQLEGMIGTAAIEHEEEEEGEEEGEGEQQD